MTEDDPPKRGPGRPKGSTTGQVPQRGIRMGPIWDEGVALAKAEGITMTALVEKALRREISRRQRQR